MEQDKTSMTSSSDLENDAGKDIQQLPADKPLAPWDPSQFPDGGSTAWLVVSGGFCFNFCSMGWINCIGVFQNYYQNNYLSEYSPSEISWIASLELFIMFFGGLIVGRVYDRYGPFWLLLFGTFMHLFGLFMLSLSTTYYQLLLSQGICSPIGIACLFTPPLSCIATWFLKKRAYAMGLFTAGSAIGGIVLPIMLNHLIPEVGFPWAIRIVAFAMGALLLFANIVVKSRLPPRPVEVTLTTYFKPLTELPYVLTTIAASFFFMGVWLPLNYLEVQAATQGMSSKLVEYLIPVVNASSLIGRILPGYIGDRIGSFNTMTIFCAFCGVVTFAVWIPTHSNGSLIAYVVLYGASSGAFSTLLPALVARISNIKEIGVRLGMEFAILSLPGLAANPIGGAFIDSADGRYEYMQIWCGAVMLTGSIMFSLARLSVSGLKMRAAV